MHCSWFLSMKHLCAFYTCRSRKRQVLFSDWMFQKSFVTVGKYFVSSPTRLLFWFEWTSLAKKGKPSKKQCGLDSDCQEYNTIIIMILYRLTCRVNQPFTVDELVGGIPILSSATLTGCSTLNLDMLVNYCA